MVDYYCLKKYNNLDFQKQNINRISDMNIYLGLIYFSEEFGKENDLSVLLDLFKNKLENKNKNNIVKYILSLKVLCGGFINVEELKKKLVRFEKYTEEYIYILEVNLKEARFVNELILKKNKKLEFFDIWVGLLMWVCVEYLNFPYDFEKINRRSKNKYMVILHCPVCMSVTLNSLLDLIITFVELNKFDVELKNLLNTSLGHLKNNCHVTNSVIDIFSDDTLLVYLLKLLTHFSSQTDTQNTDYLDNFVVVHKDKEEKQLPPFFTLPSINNENNYLGCYIPIFPFRKVLVLISKLLFITLTGQGEQSMEPLNLNFHRYSCLPKVTMMAKEEVDMRCSWDELEVFSEIQDYWVGVEKEKLLEHSKQIRPEILLISDCEGNNFRVLLPIAFIYSYSKKDNEQGTAVPIASLYKFSHIIKKLNEFMYFNRPMKLFWDHEEVNENMCLVTKIGLSVESRVNDGLFLAFTTPRHSFYTHICDFTTFSSYWNDYISKIFRKVVGDVGTMLSVRMLSLFKSLIIESEEKNECGPFREVDYYYYERNVNCSNKFCTFAYVYIYFFFAIYIYKYYLFLLLVLIVFVGLFLQKGRNTCIPVICIAKHTKLILILRIQVILNVQTKVTPNPQT
jgi:hypothetical protein